MGAGLVVRPVQDRGARRWAAVARAPTRVRIVSPTAVGVESQRAPAAPSGASRAVAVDATEDPTARASTRAPSRLAVASDPR
jgi:hypothetical protein